MSTDTHTIALSDKERTLLIELFGVQLKEEPHEIHHTDNHDYRQLPHEKANTLERMMKKVQES